LNELGNVSKSGAKMRIGAILTLTADFIDENFER